MTSALRDEATVATSGSHVLQIRQKLKEAKLKREENEGFCYSAA